MYIRQEKEATRELIRQRSLQTTSKLESDGNFSAGSSSLDTAESEEFEEQIISERNYTDLSNLAKAAIRYEVSDAAAAAIATAVLIDYGIVTESKKSQIVTEYKIFCEKVRVANSIDTKHRQEVSQIKVIGVDGKKDKNSLVYVMKYKSNGDPFFYRTTKDEHHLTFTCENDPFSGNYLTHTIIENGKGSTMASATLNVLSEYDSIKSLETIVLDNTSSNTGVDNGLVVKLEKLLNRSIHLVGCLLHQGELPLRHVISEIDGKTNDPKKYKGPIGEQASDTFMHEKPLVQFVPIDSEIELYALRIMMVYTRTEIPTHDLNCITKYIIQVYCPMWFAVKSSAHYKDAPRLLHKTIQLVKKQDSRIQIIVLKNLQGNSYCCCQENFLYAMLLDDEKVVRDHALNQILKIRLSRETNPDFKPKIKAKTVMTLNFNADVWTDLIEVSSIQIEPPTSTFVSSNELLQAIQTGNKLSLTDLPNKSQSVERAVKFTSEASKKVYGRVKRHNFILAKNQSRAENKRNVKKSEYRVIISE